MIQSIEIENFRGIQHGKLEGLTQLTILVGPNGCGKSTILDAMLLGAHPELGTIVHSVLRRRLDVILGVRWFLFRADPRRLAQITVRDNSGLFRTVQIRQSGQSVDQTDLEFSVRRGEPSGKGEGFVKTANLLDSGGGFNPNESFGLGPLQYVRLVDMRSGRQDVPLHVLFTQTSMEGRRRNINESIKSILPNIEHAEILTEGNEPVIHFVHPDYSVPAAVSGDGINALLRLCLELASRPGGLVLLEEPEVHQHPGALRQSARAILAAIRRGIQVILTTHDIELIDFLLSERDDDSELEKLSVVRLKLDDGCLKSSTLSGSEAALSRFQIEDDLR